MTEKVDIHLGGYHLTEPIGTGGMGSVFKGTVEADDKPLPRGAVVAVKLLHPHLRSVGEFVKRFHREARLAAKIDHANVVRVIEDGVVQDRHHYIVMEYVEGLKLTDLMKDGQPLSPQQTIEVMNQTCEALNAAANIADEAEPGRIRCLVHRDVKPDNIIIQPLDRRQFTTQAGATSLTCDKAALANIRVKLLDFGLAKDVKALSTILSQTGQSLGTPAYMSPEQCSGGEVDQRSDIYSLGVCAYQMIAGTAPFPGPTTVAFAKQHADEIPPDILKRNPLCPRGLADCIYRCLAKDVKDRYGSPAELQADLSRVAKGQPVAKVYRFRKKTAFSLKRVAAIVAATLVLAAAIAIAGWSLLTDRVKSDLAQAVQKADVAIAAGDFAAAKKILDDAVAAVPNRPDKPELTGPALARLKDIAARAAEQELARAREQAKAEAERQEKERQAELARARDEAARKEKERQAAEAATRRKHEQDALLALADIKAKTAAGDYQKAIDAANAALARFSDTPSGQELPNLLADATGKLRGEQAAATAREQAERDRQAAEAKAKHERFVKYRDDGAAAMKAKDYEFAKIALANALKEEPDPDAQKLLDDAIARTTRQRIAVVDFKVIGDVGIKDAGLSVAELLMPKFGDRYQVVERSQLAAILKEADLAIADIVEDPGLLKDKKIKGVRYLVIGSVNKLGNLAISARLVDIVTNPGDHVQTAEVSAQDAQGLQNAIGELAKILQMTPEEKKAYLDSARPPPPAVAPPPVPVVAPPAAGRELALDLGNRVTMKLALIPAGKFMMGSPDNEKERLADEGPQHEVTISKPFYMGVYEVTQEQYEQVMGKNPSSFKGAQNPVEMVSWDDAVEFCKKLSAKAGKTVGLPTEAQWEYACRAGTKTPFNTGETIGPDQANYNGNEVYGNGAKGEYREKTIAVGSFKPNAFGLYDMHGNVWEWCADWYGDKYYAESPKADPTGPANGTARVLRGGSWGNNPLICRSANRSWNAPGTHLIYDGFRVVVSGVGLD